MRRAAPRLSWILAAGCASTGTGPDTARIATAVDVGPTVRVEIETWAAADLAVWTGRADAAPATEASPAPRPYVTAVVELTDRPPPARICPKADPPYDPLARPSNWTFAFAAPGGAAPADATLLSVDEIPQPGGFRSVRLVYAVAPPDDTPLYAPGRGGGLYIRAVEDACRRRYALGRRREVAVPLPVVR